MRLRTFLKRLTEAYLCSIFEVKADGQEEDIYALQALQSVSLC
jgi:hypothetical protein